MDRRLLLYVLSLLVLVLHLSGTADAQTSQVLAVQTTEGIMLLDIGRDLEIGPLPDSNPTGYMAWSESGRYLAYYGTSLLEETGLQVFDMTTETTTMVDASPRGALSGSLHGVWFGDEILYYAAIFSEDGALFRTPVSAGAPEVILEGWTSLGQRYGDYIVVSQGENGYLLALPTGELTPLRQYIEHNGMTWRDDDHLLYVVNDEASVTAYEYEVSTHTEIELFHVDNGEINGTMTWRNDTLNFYLQREDSLEYTMWDGETLSTQDDPPMYSPNGAYAIHLLPGEGELYSQLSLWTQEGKRLETFTERSIEHTWSPTSDKIAYTDREGVHIYNITDGTTQAYSLCTPDICTIDILHYSCGDWSPNGRWLICNANGYRDYSLYTFLIDTEAETAVRLADVAVNFIASPVAWQPTG